MQIQVRINEEGALRNQRCAFTDRFTLVSELLQNARRAGATRIEIHYDAAVQVLLVLDDGCGLDDFQKLLSFHESGWDAATSIEERPFGVGFSKCLYAATRCIVQSGRQRVDIDTAAALEKTTTDVEQTAETDAVTGTRIVQVEPVSEQVRTVLEGRWVWPNVILCEAVRIRVGDDVAEVTSEDVCHDGDLYVPVGECSGAPVRQLASFTDEHDQFLDSDLDADRDALADLIGRLRSVDPVRTLNSLLQDLRLGNYPLLHGKTFRLTVGVGSAPGHSIELVDQDGRAMPADVGGTHAGS